MEELAAHLAERVPAWRGRDVRLAPLSGGLTNTNYRAEVDGCSYVIRVPGEGTEVLAIDRANEFHNTQIAAGLGLGARVEHHLADEQVTVLEFIHGPTMSPAALRAAGMPSELGQTVKRLHAGPRFLRDFDMFELADTYRRWIAANQLELPEGFGRRQPEIDRLRQTLATRAGERVACHNDLLAENFLHDGRQLRLVDFEYSGNNDCAFELGNLAQEMEYDNAQIEELCRAYFGMVNASDLARIKLNRIVSDYGWTLWAVIQNHVSRIEFDFWSYGQNRWRRAVDHLEAAEFDRLLADAG